jgi:RNA polymerase sigma factor (sigma-70 family)
MKDLLVQTRFRNNILWGLMAGRTVAEVCRLIGFPDQTSFGDLLNLKRQPYRTWKGKAKAGQFTAIALRIADYFKMLPEDLFPASLYALGLPDGFDRTFSSEEVFLSLPKSHQSYLPSPEDTVAKHETLDAIDSMLYTLTPREAKVVKMRFGIEGQETGVDFIADEIGVSSARVVQITARALRKLRHPSRSKYLKPYVEGIRV